MLLCFPASARMLCGIASLFPESARKLFGKCFASHVSFLLVFQNFQWFFGFIRKPLKKYLISWAQKAPFSSDTMVLSLILLFHWTIRRTRPSFYYNLTMVFFWFCNFHCKAGKSHVFRQVQIKPISRVFVTSWFFPWKPAEKAGCVAIHLPHSAYSR